MVREALNRAADENLVGSPDFQTTEHVGSYSYKLSHLFRTFAGDGPDGLRVTSDSNITTSPLYSSKSRTTRAVSQLRYVIRIAIVTDDSGQIQDFCQAHNAIRSALLNTEWRDRRAARY